MKETICTILLVSYNHASYIRKAIESVLEQKTQYEYKIHIFDDGSTDGTKEIINEYASKYPEKIKAFISEKNQGAPINFWNAYKSVDTKYCAILECDDYWCDENKLELQISALEQHPECSFCAHNTVMLNKNDKYRKENNNKVLVTAPQVKDKNIVYYDDIKNVKYGFMNHLASRILRTSCYNLDEITHREAFMYDNNQFYYMLLKGPMYYIDKVMNVYIQTGDGDFSSKTPYKRIANQLEKLAEFNKETNYVIEDKICRDEYNFIGYYLNCVGKYEFSQKPTWYKLVRKLRRLYYYLTPQVFNDIIIFKRRKLFNYIKYRMRG